MILIITRWACTHLIYQGCTSVQLYAKTRLYDVRCKELNVCNHMFMYFILLNWSIQLALYQAQRACYE
jgi:hypothetical protein